MYIRLDSVEKVQRFVNSVEKQGIEVDLISGKREVYGKSLLGIFSLDLTKPLEIKVLHDGDTEKLEKLLCKFDT